MSILHCCIVKIFNRVNINAMLRKIVFMLIALSVILTTSGQDTDSKTALLLIDIQDFYFPGGELPLYKPEVVAENAALILKEFRKKGNEVIHVRHNYEPGGNIHDAVKPVNGEKVFSKDNVNAFLDTGLKQYLDDQQITRLVICGMQTHMCVEAGVRAASDMGYECILIQDACTSRDLTFDGQTIKAMDVHLSTLSTLSSYARLMNTRDYINP